MARFNTSGAGVAVEVIRGPLDTETISDLAISSLLLGEAPFDLLLVDVSWLPKYVAAGWFVPLERWFGPEVLAAMEPGARLGNGLGEHLWRMPLTGDTGLLYWRTDLMPRPPRDTAELVAISATCSAAAGALGLPLAGAPVRGAELRDGGDAAGLRRPLVG